MARALLIGCGCCATSAGRLLIDQGWSVRGTSRDPERLPELEKAGIEPAAADPDRVGSLIELVGDVTVVAWLLGSSIEPARDGDKLWGERLPSLLAGLVDTPVRGFVHESAGDCAPAAFAAGRAAVEDAASRWQIPTAGVDPDRSDPDRWSAAVAGAVTGLLA